MLYDIEVRELELEDIYSKEGFIECLLELAPVQLTATALEKLYYDRHCTGMRTLVAVSGDFILGTGTLVIEQKFIHSGGRVGKIEDVAIHPDNQRIGIGKLIVRKLIELASEAKCYKVILSCSEKNVAFYKRIGFRKHEYTMRLDL